MSDQSALVYRRPKWGRGTITKDDARFLQELILEVRPQVAIEVGVASGCSSVAILEAMRVCREPSADSRLPSPGSRLPSPESRVPDIWLHAFDVADRCYFDPSKPTGAAVAELSPRNLPHYCFTVGDVLSARRTLSGLNIPFAFIDGNHLHPWAAVDLLGLLPCLAPRAWVALHDIRLPLIERRQGARGHGPRHLFERWPGNKRQGGSDDNIGAIELPDDLRDVAEILRSVLGQPWEVSLTAAVCSTLQITPRPIAVLTKPQAFRLLARAAAQARPLYVCGTGQAGRALAAELRSQALNVAGFADAEPGKSGLLLDGLPIEWRPTLSRGRQPRPFMAVAGVFAREIDVELETSGWVRGEDYVVL